MTYETKRLLAGALALVALAPFIFFGALSLFSRKPGNLGAVNSRLADCPDSPNCVSTQATDAAHRMDAIPFNGSPVAALETLKEIAAATPRAKIVASSENYFHAEVTTLLFRFVDDVEFLIDAESKVIHFRSASRAGRTDFGVNRNRMIVIRRMFENKN